MIKWARSLLLMFASSASVRAAPATQPTGTITGKVTSEGEVPLHELVIYLESPDAARPLPPPGQPVKVSQKGAQFAPPLSIITAGQTVEFPNDEDRLIEHNVFSNAPAKRFDLGLYPPGQRVELEDGSVALSLAPNPQDPARPHVRLVSGPGALSLPPGSAPELRPLPPESSVRRALPAEERPEAARANAA